MSTIFPTTVPAKRLSESITGASSSFKVNNIQGWDGNNLTSSDFGTKLYAVFRNSAGTLMEIMEVDPATIASASITILLRGLKFTGDLTTEVSGNKLTWVKGDTIVEFGTHVPQLLKHYVDDLADQSIAGVKTFSSFPKKSGTTTPTSSDEFATKAYADAVGAGSATYDQNIVPGVAGEDLVAGNLVYFKTSDGRFWKTDADTASTVDGVILAFAQGTILTGATGNFLIGGIDKNQSGLVAGTTYYASNTAGGISSSAGTTERVIGKALTATQIMLKESFATNPTAREKSILTQILAGTDLYGASAAGTDSYAITPTPAIAAYVTGMRFRFKADVANTGAATLSVSGLSAITIKKAHDQDLADNDIEVGSIVEVVYDGTNFQMVSQLAASLPAPSDIQTFTSTGAGTWTKPSGSPKKVFVQMWGAGGSGGRVIGNASGGGGGAYIEKWFNASDLGATESVSVGAGGSQAGSASYGNNGGNTTFGSGGTLITAYGGQSGAIGTAGNATTGGNGGGYLGIGSPGSPFSGAGASGAVGGNGQMSGAGGGVSSGNAGQNGGSSFSGGAGGGGAGSSAGTGGSSIIGGAGGAGNASGAGVAGSVPGGGGGGSGNNTAGGAGGDGKIIVTTFY